MIRKHPRHDLDNPPGQIVNPVGNRSPENKLYKPVHGGYPGTGNPEKEINGSREPYQELNPMEKFFKDHKDFYDSEEAFTPPLRRGK